MKSSSGCSFTDDFFVVFPLNDLNVFVITLRFGPNKHREAVRLCFHQTIRQSVDKISR